MYTFLAPSSAFEARLVGKSIVFCLQISLLSGDYGDVILKVVVKTGEARTGKRSDREIIKFEIYYCNVDIIIRFNKPDL